MEARLHTGRTHQIRVHFAHKHHPVAGDSLYGSRRQRNPLGLQRQFLHAHFLGFDSLDGRRIEVVSPLPPDLQSVLDRLRSEYGMPATGSAGDDPWWLQPDR